MEEKKMKERSQWAMKTKEEKVKYRIDRSRC